MIQKTDFPFEILIHDDASTDDTVQIILDYQKKYPDLIKPIFQEKNLWSQGTRALSATYNFPRAQGKYIA
ncbi:MAG: glycosyltransferase, partial [Cyclobacteriaceae bacterium]|nr:glycosyltransferase [Cyclobacteriaceae bacterium]